MWLRIYKHLLPRAKAWQITFDKQLRQFFDGLTAFPAAIKVYCDLVWLDIFPDTTRALDLWEKQWALPNTGLTTQERRDRLDATWKATGGQDPKYIQDTLQAAGFDVYIHEWWVPGSEAAVNVHAAATPRDPTTILIVGNAYHLVNKITSSERKWIAQFGGASIQFGVQDEESQFGNYDGLKFVQKEYIIPTDPTKWPYFIYLGGATFPNFASVPLSRKDEFEDLALKLCPCQNWLGILVNYV